MGKLRNLIALRQKLHFKEQIVHRLPTRGSLFSFIINNKSESEQIKYLSLYSCPAAQHFSETSLLPCKWQRNQASCCWQYVHNHQTYVLSDDSSESEDNLCLYQLWKSIPSKKIENNSGKRQIRKIYINSWKSENEWKFSNVTLLRENAYCLKSSAYNSYNGLTWLFRIIII